MASPLAPARPPQPNPSQKPAGDGGSIPMPDFNALSQNLAKLVEHGGKAAAAYFKPYAAVRHVHYGAHAALGLRAQFDLDTLEHIDLWVYQEALTYCGVRQPQTPLQAQFSLSFGVAGMLRWGHLNSTVYASPDFEDAWVQRLEKKVTIHVHDEWTQKQWLLSGQVQWLHARISGTSVDTSLNGTQPINAPAITIRALAQYRWTKLPGLRTNLRLSHEGQRSAYKDGSINLPAWTTMDFAAHYETRIQGTRSELTLGIDNLMNKQYWRESPKQFGHYYLYPGAPRNLRLTVRTLF
jgi:hypothetical protein